MSKKNIEKKKLCKNMLKWIYDRLKGEKYRRRIRSLSRKHRNTLHNENSYLVYNPHEFWLGYFNHYTWSAYKKKRRKRVKKWIKIKKNEEQRTTKPITWGVKIDALFIGKHTLAVRIWERKTNAEQSDATISIWCRHNNYIQFIDNSRKLNRRKV